MTPFRLFVLSVSIVIVGLGAALVSLIPPDDCSRESFCSLGEFASKEAALRASIPRLSSQLDLCPKAEVFRVTFISPNDQHGSQDRHALLYYRDINRIGYEDDFMSGFSEESHYADDSTIRGVAQAGGTIDDFPRKRKASN